MAVPIGLAARTHALALEAVERGGEKRPELGPHVGLERAQTADLVARTAARSASAVAAISRAFARASSTIRSASRWARARSSSAIRSAESSVLRSASSISRWRRQLALELLDLVAQVGAVAPDVLEARGDVVEQAVDAGTLVAERTPTRA